MVAIKKQCEVCGGEFSATHDDAVYCSRCIHAKMKAGYRPPIHSNPQPTPPPTPTIRKPKATIIFTQEQANEAAEKLGLTLEDAKQWGRALVRWRAAGYPKRDDAEVARIHDTLCVPCETNGKSNYVDGRCRLCRCRVNKGMALFNKIRMGTERCPIGKWGDL